MATGNDDNDVDGDGATGDEVNDDGDGATGDNNDDNNNGDDGDDGDGDDDGDGGDDDDDDDDDGNDDGGGRRRHRGRWQRHAAFVSGGYDKGVVVEGVARAAKKAGSSSSSPLSESWASTTATRLSFWGGAIKASPLRES